MNSINKVIPFVFLTILLLIPHAMAFDGEIKFGKYFNSTEQSSIHSNQYYNSVEVGHQIDMLRPYLLFETFMDEFMIDYKIDPSSMKLAAGLEILFSDNFSIDLKHMYFHPVNSNGVVEEYDYAGITFKF